MKPELLWQKRKLRKRNSKNRLPQKAFAAAYFDSHGGQILDINKSRAGIGLTMKENINGVIKEIERFKPLCEQEKKDKEIMLFAIKKEGFSILTRANELFHITVSGFTVNNDKSKMLMVFHNIYNSWSWIGGHADGETGLLSVALREAREETGIEHIFPEEKEILSLDILTTKGHWKKGNYIAPHLHFNITYLLTGDERDAIRPKEDENKAVGWILMEDIENRVTEPEMLLVYKKLLQRI